VRASATGNRDPVEASGRDRSLASRKHRRSLRSPSAARGSIGSCDHDLGATRIGATEKSASTLGSTRSAQIPHDHVSPPCESRRARRSHEDLVSRPRESRRAMPSNSRRRLDISSEPARTKPQWPSGRRGTATLPRQSEVQRTSSMSRGDATSRTLAHWPWRLLATPPGRRRSPTISGVAFARTRRSGSATCRRSARSLH
jgi:hypothetical protein